MDYVDASSACETEKLIHTNREEEKTEIAITETKASNKDTKAVEQMRRVKLKVKGMTEMEDRKTGRYSHNPFDSDSELPLTQPIKKKVTKPKTKAVKSKAKKCFPLGSDSEAEVEVVPMMPTTSSGQSKKKRKILPESEDDEHVEEPVVAGKLKTYFSRRVASGVTQQSDPSKQGEYYVEVRVSLCKELEATSSDDRWKHSLVSLKTAVNNNSTTWKAVTHLINAVKEDFQGVRPVLYPHEK